ncbi:MAG: class I SAM-dependent methyltransferase, partial [Candidatus Woesearchaeota archaeon]|nr:class I SAM-dependent methyltransferase [Candidatus Woesearchaeota archaeon]
MGIVYPLGGKLYDLLDEHYEKSRYAKIRKHMLGNLGNTILDAGCGTGRNFQYFSPNAKINGVDLSPKMLEAAKKRAQNAKIPIKLERMNLTNLHFKDNLFDNVVATFVLCVLPKKYEQQALKELIRVAKPGAKLHFLEYVYSQDPVRNLTMKATSFI